MDIPDATSLKADVEAALLEIRGALALHGGDVELLDIDMSTGVVTVRLHGACAGCPMADLTVSGLIEETIRERVPSITKVINRPA
ncbi:NifU family protein [Patescibacteria group bacterium]|nr:NifU family protein [Patescibacteria group bacterium]MBU1448632.1 NifU family protein [Patescibacteria group bacterium]MBU2613088.1 NifU family protein [Patescibacteria group bacterium]